LTLRKVMSNVRKSFLTNKRGAAVKLSIFKIMTVLGLLSWSSLSFALNANSGQNISLTDNDSPNLSFALQSGLLNGETLEQVFITGRKISELKWDLSNVLYVGGAVSSELWERVYLNAGYWTKAASSLGEMTDSDFLSANPLERTLLSIHDAELDKLDIMDLNLGVAFLKFGGETVSSASPFGIDSALSFQAILGYRKDDVAWSSQDGFLFYPETLGAGVPIFGDGIDYESNIHFPYIGLGIDLTISKKLGVNIYYLKSSSVRVEALDKHFLRDLKIRHSMSNGKFQAIGANLRWEIWKKLSLIASISAEDIDNTEGTDVRSTLSTNEVDFGLAGGTSAIENEILSASVGVSYSFS